MNGLPEQVTALAAALAECPGVVGVVLGGSWARGRNRPDSDVDLGLYYDSTALDWSVIADRLTKRDDRGTPRGLAPPGAWGPWMNGGAWLEVNGLAVDVLLRDFHFIESVAADATKGIFSSNYLPGFPHGWHSFMSLSEVYYNVPLSGDVARLRDLRASIAPYPEALRTSVIDRFLYEAKFSALLLHKLEGRDEAVQSAGLAYRCAMCLVHVLFALNHTYLVNEKGAVAVASGFEHLPAEFVGRIDGALGRSDLSQQHRAAQLSRLVADVEYLACHDLGFTPSWNASSFPTG